MMGKQDKLTMHTSNLANNNFAALAAMFPNAVTEAVDENGEVIRTIDADVLAQEINTRVVSGKEERYQFTWPDKKKSVLLANEPIAATLRPCREESVDFDNTENLYIEGDNLDVLKLLRETYLNRVKLVYIDPPYNTGKDFIYEDNFAEETSEFLRRDGQYDDLGNRLISNFDSNGRFHTDWLNMIYPRLRVARDILAEDGVIFISIDDNEVHNLRKICDEIYGQSNFVAKVIWERSFAPVNLKKHFSNSHDYILCYAKNLNMLICNGLPRSEGTDNNYKNLDNDPRGLWTSSDMTVGPVISEKLYDITLPSGRKIKPTSGRCWLYTKDKYEEMVKDNRIWFGKSGDNTPRVKKFLSEVKQGITPMTIWKYSEVEHSQEAAQNLKKLFDGKDYFDYPKPVKLIKRMLELYTNSDSIIVDFFSGSATTAHSVMQLNTEDEGERKFIMVQIPEETDPKSEAYKDGYRDICEIGKERIRRAGTKIKEEAGLTAQNLDTGFRVLKLDSSNMKEVYYTPEEYSQMGFNLEGFMDNIKPDRSDEDLLFQVMLDLGIPLSARIEQDGKIFKVNENYLIACFDRVDTSMITEIAQKQPYYAIFRDSSFVNDSALVNVEQIFNTYSPSTIRRVL
jgi:adenine-specific DNA-methyltransferase